MGESGIARWTTDTVARWRIPPADASADAVDEVPGTIKAVQKVDTKLRILLQSTKLAAKIGDLKGAEGMQGLGFRRDGPQQQRVSSEGQSQTTFEVRLVEIAIDGVGQGTTRDDTKTRTAKVLWTVRGDEPLITATLTDQEALLGAEAPFATIANQSSQSKLASRSTGTESVPSTSPAAQAAIAPRGRRRAPHFSWAQTGDTVTIAFVLPSWITKSHIRAHFSLSALSLSFTQEALNLLGTSSSAKITEIGEASTHGSSHDDDDDDDLTHAAQMIASGRYVSRSTWAEIDPTGSLWTLERARGMSLLTLHLEKKHEGTRWMQVFADRTGTHSRNRNLSSAERAIRVKRS